MEVTIVLTVEAKDEYSGGEGRLPDVREVVSAVNDRLVDSTRGDFELSWMVRAAYTLLV